MKTMKTQIDDREFMLHPEKWPKTFLTKKIFLKKTSGVNGPFSILVYLNGRWGFCLETAPFEPDISTARWGGPELVEEIIADGWLVD
jgi:hypothetical protein